MAAAYRLTSFGVLRGRDGAFIPADLLNSDWKEYLLWRDGGIRHTLAGDIVVQAGGPPDPQYTPEELAQQGIDQAAAQQIADNLAQTKLDALVAFFAKQSPASVEAYFTNNVTNFNQAVTVLKAVTKICCVLAARL